MNKLMINAFPIACVVGAAFLAYNNKDGWGWLIALAFFTSHMFVSGDKNQ